MNRSNTNRRGRGRSSFAHSRSSTNFKSKRAHSRRSSSRRGGSINRSHKQKRGGRKMASFNPSQFINANPVDDTQEVYVSKHKFNEFGLNQGLVNNIAKLSITIPTPIQDQIIPHVLSGRDVIGLAETGTGKTAAFLVPLIEKALKDKSRQTLILAPTRELAIQIEAELRRLARGLKLFSVVCVGGVNIRPQIRDLRHLNHFVIGTPGRILDLIRRKCLRTRSIRTVVLDEADQMLDMGFITDIRTILLETPENRETLFFSATMTKEAQGLVHDFLKDPIEVSVKKKDVVNTIEQDVVSYRHKGKFDTLLGLISKPEFSRVLIFGSMKHSVEKLAKELSKYEIKATSIHGNKNHNQRQRALSQFKTGQAKVLVATDVAARGIHVDNVTHVINYDLPNSFEDYVHRIGRTGRGSRRGKALTFVAS